MAGQSSSQAATPFQWWKPALFFLVVIFGLWYVKWQPYYGKAFTAAETHSIGQSILARAATNPWRAAWDYAMVYFIAVWKAAVLGVLLGSLIQVLIPRDWLRRTLGASRFRGTLFGTLFSLPGMMCTCCAAPVVAGMRRRQASMGGALAFWMGNPLLNPATLVFMGFVLGWHFAAIRLIAGLAMVLVVATLVQTWVQETPQPHHASGAR
ncbi:membrane permease [Salmonella bongori]|nr:membrane permease [Salmonella bongori]